MRINQGMQHLRKGAQLIGRSGSVSRPEKGRMLALADPVC
jgi:hypothetical protein